MDEFLSKLAEQFAVIRAAPYPFLLSVAIVIGAVWFMVNWAYGTILSSKNAQLELADRQLGDYRQKLSGASPDEAKSKIEALTTEINQLRAQLQARRLTPAQRDAIAQTSRLAPGQVFSIQIMRDMGASDGGAYANDFMAVFQAAGWKVSYGSILFGTPAPTGLALLVKSSSLSAAEKMVFDALRGAQIQFDVLAGC
jgi:hypothetical protein